MNELRQARIEAAELMDHNKLAESFVDSVEECRRLRKIAIEYTKVLNKITPDIVEENDIYSLPTIERIYEKLKKRGISVND